MSQLKGISEYCGQLNLGGLVLIEYAPVHWIYPPSLDPIIHNWNHQTDIQFYEGAWLKAPVLPSRRIWKEVQRSNEQGPYYEQSIEGIVPNLKPPIAEEFQQMAQMRFLLRLEDRNQQKWLLGSLDSPFEFSTSGSTGNTGERNGHNIRFSSQTARKAYGFNPVFS